MSTWTLILLLIQHTPAWVWPLVAVVLAFGIYNLRSRRIAAPRLVVFPLVMLGLSLSSALGTAAPPALGAGAWIAAAGLGAALGWILTALRSGSIRPSGGSRFPAASCRSR